MAKRVTEPTWICDRCKKEHVGATPPNTPQDAWGKLKIDQDAGWDFRDHPWAPRMKGPLHLCGACIEEVVSIINNISKPINILFDGPPGHDSGRFVEVETDDGRSINVGEWIQRGNYWVLRIPALPRSHQIPDGA